MHKLVAAHSNKYGKLVWSEEGKIAFRKSKYSLCEMTTLLHPVQQAKLSLQTDASGSHVAGILQQKNGDYRRSIAFFSKSLSPAEKNYSTFDRELLDAFRTCEKFRYYIDGKHVTLLTDHRPLIGALTKAADRSPRQEKQLSFLAQFVDKIEHISGEANLLPDLLSQKLVASFSGFNSQFSLADITRVQIGDSEICELIRNPSALVLQFVSIDQSSDLKLLCDASQPELRPVAPL